MFSPLFSLLAGVLAFFYQLIPNYAVAITLLTLTVMAVLTPITLKGTRSMLALQKLQPEMQRIQQEYKNDKAALNEALMAFYREHKINPLSGCLPMIAQLPVLLVMFRVLRGLIQTKHGFASPAYLKSSSKLYQALAFSHGERVKGAPKMISFGIDFAAKPTDHGAGSIALLLLVALVVVTGYWQVRQMQARTTQAAATNPQAQMMTKVMPLFSGLISFSLPGGVSLYFLVSNLFRIGQQTLMYRFDPNLREHMVTVREVKSREAQAPAKPRASFFGGPAAARPNAGGNGNGKAATRPKSAAPGRVTPAGQSSARRKKKKRR